MSVCLSVYLLICHVVGLSGCRVVRLLVYRSVCVWTRRIEYVNLALLGKETNGARVEKWVNLSRETEGKGLHKRSVKGCRPVRISSAYRKGLRLAESDI